VGVFLTAALLEACAAGGTGQVYQFQIADDAAVVSAKSLYSAGSIDVGSARSILTDAVAAEAALRALDAANQGGDATAIAAALNAVEAALQALDQQLAGVAPAPASAALARQRVHVSAKPGDSIAAYLAIIQLAAELTPELINWLNLATAQSGITEAQVAAEFVTLDADIQTLQAAITAGK
jgi:hypothetical protein